MRPSNKRSRSKQNRPRSLGNIVNRVFDSSGPEGKVRGTPQQIIDKYSVLARDAQLSGDRVAAENFLQHAEHYTRMLNEAQAELAREAEQRRDQQFQGGQNPGQNNGQNGGGQGGNGQNHNNQNNGGNQGRNDNQQNRRNDQRDQRGEGGEGDGDQRPSWKQERNRRFEERRQQRESGDPRDDSPAEPESMLVETPESRRSDQPEVTTPAAAPAEVPAPEAPEAGTPASEAPATEAPAPKKPRAPRSRKPKAPTEPAPDAAAE